MTNQSQSPKIITKKHVARLEREKRMARLIRWIAIGGILIVAGLVGYGFLDLSYLRLQKPAVEVNGEVISIKTWQERVQVQRLILQNQYQQLQYQQSFGLDTTQQQQQILSTLQLPEVLGQQALDALIDEALIRQEAKKRGLAVTAAELDEVIQSAYGFFPNGTKTPTVTPTEFPFPTMSSQQLTLYPSTATSAEVLTSTPAPTGTPDPSVTATATATQSPATPTFVPEPATATSTPYTIDGFKKSYGETVDNLKNTGISEATLRSVYEANLLRDKLFESMVADVPHTEEQVWARHILASDETALGIVRSLLAAHREFVDIAKKYSADTGSGANGGDLGWFGKGQMVPEFEKAAFSQKIGEIGEPVKSQFGYHIIQVLGHADVPLTESQYQQKREAAFTEWLAKAKEEATITNYETWKQFIPTEPASPAQP